MVTVRASTSDDPRWIILSLLGAMTLAAVDLTTGEWLALSGLYVVAPAIAGTVLPPRLVLVTTACTAILIALVALAGGAGALSARVSVGVGVLAVGVLSSLVAARRVQREKAYEQLSRVAAVAQATIIRPIPERLGQLALASVYRSAAQEAQVGGDAYAVLSTPHGVRAVIADVRGKGLGAVAIAADLLASFRETAATDITLAALAHRLDASIRPQLGPADFVTALLVQIGSGQLTLVSCGHPWPLLLREGSITEIPITRPSPPLGLAVRPEEQSMRFAAGDQILLFTDGLIEARNKDRQFFDPIPALAASPADATPRELLTRLTAALDCHVAGRQSDDLAALLIRHLDTPPNGYLQGRCDVAP
jgi:serine phosphatase RsbU (regulator of sigma subunit)